MILITGVTGTVGRAVLEQAAGVPARVLIRDAAGAAAFEDVAEVAIGDFADPASLEAAVAGIDAAFMASFDGAEQLALQGNLIAAAKHAGVRHMVRLSALSSDENAEAALARWHGVADRQLVGSGLGYTLLRPGLFAQNLLEYAASGAIALPVGETRVSFIDVRDIAAVAVKALTEPGHEGQTYELTGAEQLTYGEVAERLTAATGRQFTFRDMSDDEYHAEMLRQGREPWDADMVVELYRRMRAQGTRKTTDTVERLLGRPPIGIEAFARDHAAAFAGAD